MRDEGQRAAPKYLVLICISYDKGTPVARPVRKAKDLTPRQPGYRKGNRFCTDNLYDHGVAA
jgi:hypothetical protein